MGRLEEDTGLFSGEVVKKCVSMCAAANYKGADFMGGLHVSECWGFAVENTPCVQKLFFLCSPHSPQSLLLCTVWEQRPTGVTEGRLKTKHEMLQP